MVHPRLCVVVAALGGLVCLAGCRRPAAGHYLDLIHLLPGAQKRSALPAERAFQIVDADVEGVVKPSIRTCGASRIIWAERLPDNPSLRTAIAVDRDEGGVGPVTFRIAIGGRHYDQLYRRELPVGPGVARWQMVSIDLGAYHGWQWSIFYRPSSMTWSIMFTTDTAPSPDGRTRCGYWAQPRIESTR